MSTKVAPATATGPPSSSASTSANEIVKRKREEIRREETQQELEPALQRDKNDTKKGRRHAPLVRNRDKVMFCISAFNAMILSFFTGGYQWLLPYYYTALILPFLVLRMWRYGRTKNAYFLLDLCYWGNYLLLIYLWTPTYQYSEYFFATVYALATGPMAWAVIIFRNSLVFHSLDKSTSNFIHLGPVLTVFSIRWHTPVAENLSVNTTDWAGHPRDVYAHNWTGFGRFKICETDQPCFQSWWLWFFLVPMGVQFVWACFFPLASRVCCPIKEYHVDSYRYVGQTQRMTWVSSGGHNTTKR